MFWNAVFFLVLSKHSRVGDILVDIPKWVLVKRIIDCSTYNLLSPAVLSREQFKINSCFALQLRLSRHRFPIANNRAIPISPASCIMVPELHNSNLVELAAFPVARLSLH